MSDRVAEIDLPEVDGLVHEPVRLRLLAYLSILDRADFVFLLTHTGVSRGNLSVQMRVSVSIGLGHPSWPAR